MPHILNDVDSKPESVTTNTTDTDTDLNPLSSSSSNTTPPPQPPPPQPTSQQQQSSSASSSSSSMSTSSSSQSNDDHHNKSPDATPKKSNCNNMTITDIQNTSSGGQDDCDEIKVYNEEGAEEEEQLNTDNLTEEKTEIIEAKPTASTSHPFSVNNLMLLNQSDPANQSNPLNPFILGYRNPLYNPLYSPELASHFAAWWPAAAAASAAALYNPVASSFSAFSAAAAAASYQQQQFAAAAALSRFNPSLFLNSAAAAAAAASVKSEPGTNPHSHASSSTSSSSSSASPFSSSSTTSNSSNKLNPPLQNSKQFNQYNNHPTKMNIKSEMSPRPMGMSGPQMAHNGPAPPPPPHIQLPPKSKKPHIKKPLNAFMLFMKEQRAKVVNECTLRESAAINQILGRKWHELERGEQAKYYEMARQERLKHMQLYPGWSARDNYGLKKKRRRKREKVIGENGELPRKCRARYGLQQINLWCKPCRRKKKCIRFAGNNENADGQNNMNQPMIMGPNGQMYPNPMYNPMMGDSAAGSAGSLNGGNSEDDYEDDYDDMGDEILPGGQEDETDEETDSEDDENELNDSKDLSGIGQYGSGGYSPMYHPPAKKPNLDLGMNGPLQQIQQQFHQQFSQHDSKHDIMQQIQQMQQMHHSMSHAMNYQMFGAPDPAQAVAPN